jgi:hypothetical protein
VLSHPIASRYSGLRVSPIESAESRCAERGVRTESLCHTTSASPSPLPPPNQHDDSELHPRVTNFYARLPCAPHSNRLHFFASYATSVVWRSDMCVNNGAGPEFASMVFLLGFAGYDLTATQGYDADDDWRV